LSRQDTVAKFSNGLILHREPRRVFIVQRPGDEE
jgi:hypothetical protein